MTVRAGFENELQVLASYVGRRVRRLPKGRTRLTARHNGINHVVLTVSDLDRSTAWYCDLFDLSVVSTEENIGPPYFTDVRYRGLFDLDTMSYVIGLAEHRDGSPPTFDATRIGLDHCGFGVAQRVDLDDWVGRLDDRQIPHSGIIDALYATVVSFRDPDGIALELSFVRFEFWGDLISRLGPVTR
jgi:glyoxylase I family protein